MFVSTTTNHALRLATNRWINGTSLTIEANGAVTCNSSFCSSSDSKLKSNQALANLSDMQDIFNSVNVKTYDRIDLNGQKRVGFVAQEIEAVLPESYRHIVGDGTIQRGDDEEAETIKTVDYSRLVCILWGVCKGLTSRIEVLESRLP